jgi:hypothetical protein
VTAEILSIVAGGLEDRCRAVGLDIDLLDFRLFIKKMANFF